MQPHARSTTTPAPGCAGGAPSRAPFADPLVAIPALPAAARQDDGHARYLRAKEARFHPRYGRSWAERLGAAYRSGRITYATWAIGAGLAMQAAALHAGEQPTGDDIVAELAGIAVGEI